MTMIATFNECLLFNPTVEDNLTRKFARHHPVTLLDYDTPGDMLHISSGEQMAY